MFTDMSTVFTILRVSYIARFQRKSNLVLTCQPAISLGHLDVARMHKNHEHLGLSSPAWCICSLACTSLDVFLSLMPEVCEYHTGGGKKPKSCRLLCARVKPPLLKGMGDETSGRHAQAAILNSKGYM